MAAKEKPVVGIRIPKVDNGESSLNGDQFEHVTINGKTTMIRCGDYVEVPVDVYEVLKVKYPNL